jgi:acetyltransferase-like isoleucine patch superfamily enzyme
MTTTTGWRRTDLPANVSLGPDSILTGDQAFRRFHSQHAKAIAVGAGCLLDGVQFAVGVDGQVEIGDNCYFTNAVLLSEQRLQFGSRVVIGWNATVADSDFHPLPPELRWADAEACSPLAAGRVRPSIECRPVIVEDDVYIGPNAALLKGVHIGAGAFIEPGSVVTTDVPRRARVMGNPARIVGEV